MGNGTDSSDWQKEQMDRQPIPGVVWEYSFDEEELDDPQTTMAMSSESIEDVAESLTEEYNDDGGDYPEETVVWIRKLGETAWQRFTVFLEVRHSYRATKTVTHG